MAQLVNAKLFRKRKEHGEELTEMINTSLTALQVHKQLLVKMCKHEP